MRLATFNVLHGLPARAVRPEVSHGLDDRPIGPLAFTDVEPLREAVAALDADVLGLQEVDVHQERSGGHHQVLEAARSMGAAHWRFAPAVRGTPGVERRWDPADGDDDHGSDEQGADGSEPDDAGPRYGVGLVTRLEVLEWRTHRFDPAPWSLPLLVPGERRPQVMRIPDEPRAAVAAVILGPHGPMTVATVHLSFVPGYNVRQLREVRAWLAGMPRPLVLLGDLNLPGRIPSRVTRWTQLARVATYPSYGPRVQFDHVLADGLTAVQAARASATARAVPLGVSDHCALVIDLSLDERPDARGRLRERRPGRP